MGKIPDLHWVIKPFSTLSTGEMYDILKLRVDVFVVEQNCPYPEIDGKDTHPETLHLAGRDRKGALLAYLRILPPGLNFHQACIGRVVVAEAFRQNGLCTRMVETALEEITNRWPGQDVRVGAQVYVKEFYRSLGFYPVSDHYLEDGIPHVDMVCHPQDQGSNR